MKNTLVTSLNPQVQAIIDMVGIAAMHTVRIRSEELTTAARQRVLAQGDKFTIELSAFITAKMTELSEHVGYLKLISGDETIIIGETDGKDTIARAIDLFTGGVNLNFLNHGTNIKGKPTKETKVEVFDMIKHGDFANIFWAFGENLDRFCLTQSQIIRFVKDHCKRWLRKDGGGTFFLFKENGKFFIANVYWSVCGFSVIFYRWSDDHVWDARYRLRFVVPKL